MKYIYFILILMFGSCSSSNFKSYKSFKLTEATVQSWTRGKELKGSPNSGTTYTMKFNKIGGLEVKHVWLKAFQYPFKIKQWDDNFWIVVETYQGEFDNKKKATLPISYTGEGLVEYTVNNKTYYQVIETFTLKEGVMGE